MANIIKSKFFWLFIYFFIALNCANAAYDASPCNWLYPEGNSEALLRNERHSAGQKLDSFKLKWTTTDIVGDVVPLIGNIIDNGKLSSGYPFAPNEITALVGGKIVVVDAMGKTRSKATAPSFVKSISALFDTSQTSFQQNTVAPVILGIESIEFENTSDSLAYGYLASYDPKTDSVAMRKRLAIDLRNYKPNISASIRPVYCRKSGDSLLVYATVNMSRPTIGAKTPPFLRGLTIFKTKKVVSSYPFPDIGDDYVNGNRIELGPEVAFAQPSIGYFDIGVNRTTVISMPSYPTTYLNNTISDDIALTSNAKTAALFNFDITKDKTQLFNSISGFFQKSGTWRQPSDSLKVQLRPKVVRLYNGGTGSSEDSYVLVAQEFRGIDTSLGRARLYLFDKDLTKMPADTLNYTYDGGYNHCWSIATGDIDGANNESLPYYPNNPGNEIVVTQSTKEFAVENNRLSVLRYNINTDIPKISPPGQFLKQFDTICTKKINGWLALVNDLDGAPNGKEEIVLVDGSTLKVLQMRDYNDDKFSTGDYFKTLFTYTFKDETISSVEVADLEGDDLNDLIVTTNVKTYVLGTSALSSLSIIYPADTITSSLDFCVGDTVPLKWQNLVKGSDFVTVEFQKYLNGSPIDSAIVLDSLYANATDTVLYKFAPDSSYKGVEGKLIVVSNNDKTIRSASAIIKIAKPTLIFDVLAKPYYYVGEKLALTGTALCLDSVEIQYRIDSARWGRLSLDTIAGKNGTFTSSFTVPCTQMFSGAREDIDSVLHLRAIAYTAIYADTTDSISAPVHAKPFPIYYDTCADACPSILFTWKTAEIDFPSDTIQIVLKNDTNYSFVAEVPTSVEKYLWSVPIKLQDSTRLRFWAKGSCSRTDTLVKTLEPKYIEMVSPNPLDPSENQMEIIYKTPKNTNVTMKIYDQNNQIVKTLLSGAYREEGIAYCEKWDGKTISGAYCANGMYYIVLDFEGGGRDLYPAFIKR